MTGAGTLGSVPATTSMSGQGRGHGLRDRLVALIRELSKFGTVGGIAFLIDFAIFNVLLNVGLEPLAAKTISTVVAASVAFVGNRFWTWRHRQHHNMALQYTTFFALNARASSSVRRSARCSGSGPTGASCSAPRICHWRSATWSPARSRDCDFAVNPVRLPRRSRHSP